MIQLKNDFNRLGRGLLIVAALWGGIDNAEAARRNRNRHSECAVELGGNNATPANARAARQVEPGSNTLTTPARRIEDIKEFNILTYNLLNLESQVRNVQRDTSGNRAARGASAKAKDFRVQQAGIILELQPDVGVFQEVDGGGPTLDRFNHSHLHNYFATLLNEGNDQRGIQVGMFLKRDLPFDVEYRSNKDHQYEDDNGNSRNVFSRDVPEMILRIPGQAKPFLIILGTHYKSKRSRDGDHESNGLRKAQVDATVEIIEELWQEFGAKIPVILAGDFNGNFNNEEEFASLKSALAMEDPFNLLKVPSNSRDRVTHTFHPRGGQTNFNQLDYLLVSPEIKECVKKASVYRYKDASGRDKALPNTFDERSLNPSDHFPVMLTLDMDCLRKVWQRGH